MCGLIGMIQYKNNGFDFRARDALTPMLLLNSMRGSHSTGLFGVEVQKKHNKETVDKVSWVKKIGSPYNLFPDTDYKRFISKVWSDFHVVVGHGRYATRGNVIAANAHPFHEGNIVLVHNGGLTNLWDFSVGDKKADQVFDVDSNAAAYFLNEMDARDFLGKIKGAFAFIWYDRRERALYAVRNGDRPLTIAVREEAGNRGIFFSSEDEVFDYLRAKWPEMKLGEAMDITPGYLYRFPIGTADSESWSKEQVEFAKTYYQGHSSSHRGYGSDDPWDMYSAHHYRPEPPAHIAANSGDWECKNGIWTRKNPPPSKVTPISDAISKLPPNGVIRRWTPEKDGAVFRLGDWVGFYPMTADLINKNASVPAEEKVFAVRGVLGAYDKGQVLCHFKGDWDTEFKGEVLLAGQIKAMTPSKEEGFSMLLYLRPELKMLSDVECQRVMNGSDYNLNDIFKKEEESSPFVKLKNGDEMPVHRFEDRTQNGCVRCHNQIDITDAVGCMHASDVDQATPDERSSDGLFCPDCVIRHLTH
jgi:hypothetical protein